jgi:hypothetical protein
LINISWTRDSEKHDADYLKDILKSAEYNNTAPIKIMKAFFYDQIVLNEFVPEPPKRDDNYDVKKNVMEYFNRYNARREELRKDFEKRSKHLTLHAQTVRAFDNAGQLTTDPGNIKMLQERLEEFKNLKPSIVFDLLDFGKTHDFGKPFEAIDFASALNALKKLLGKKFKSTKYEIASLKPVTERIFEWAIDYFAHVLEEFRDSNQNDQKLKQGRVAILNNKRELNAKILQFEAEWLNPTKRDGDEGNGGVGGGGGISQPTVRSYEQQIEDIILSHFQKVEAFDNADKLTTNDKDINTLQKLFKDFVFLRTGTIFWSLHQKFKSGDFKTPAYIDDLKNRLDTLKETANNMKLKTDYKIEYVKSLTDRIFEWAINYFDHLIKEEFNINDTLFSNYNLINGRRKPIIENKEELDKNISLFLKNDIFKLVESGSDGGGGTRATASEAATESMVMMMQVDEPAEGTSHKCGMGAASSSSDSDEPETAPPPGSKAMASTRATKKFKSATTATPAAPSASSSSSSSSTSRSGSANVRTIRRKL